MRLKTRSGCSLFESQKNSLEEYSESSSVLVSSHAKIVADELLLSAADYPGITLDQWVVVPDALYALVFLQDQRGLGIKVGKPQLLTAFIAGFKTVTAKRINLVRNQPGSPVWQRSYTEQRIEDELMLSRLRQRLSNTESVLLSS